LIEESFSFLSSFTKISRLLLRKHQISRKKEYCKYIHGI
jgi:hypothetical protein